MKILALEKELAVISDEQFAPHLRPEAARAWELYQKGTIRELYFRQDQPKAVLWYRIPDLRDCSDNWRRPTKP